MDIFEKFVYEKTSDKKANGILDLINRIVGNIESITEFNTTELKAISFLENDKYLSEMLVFYKANKKHIKRKHSKELLEALKTIANAFQQNESVGGN